MNPEEREWQAQQRAVECERNGNVRADEASLVASYLPIARALRQPIPVQLPADFAARVAGMALLQSSSVEIESTLEQRLVLLLSVVLGISGLIVGLIYGASWFVPALGRIDQMGQSSLTLVFGLMACLGISALAQQVRRIADRDDPVTA